MSRAYADHADEIAALRASVAGVQILRIPSEAARLEFCRAMRIPRLLYLEGNVAAPQYADPMEDWVRPPVPNGDLSVRIARLCTLAAIYMTPSIDGDGIVRFGASRISVTPVQAVLMSRLIESYQAAVRREVLEHLVWLGESRVRRNALDVHVLRLRRRLAQVDLSLRTVWGVGYVLEPVPGQLRQVGTGCARCASGDVGLRVS